MDKMSVEQYLKERLEDQMNWYTRKSSWNKTWYWRLQSLQIVVAALIPFVSALSGSIPADKINIIVGALGVTVAIATAAQSLFKYQENWVKYRATAEQLQRERFLFLAGVEPYHTPGAYELLVKRIESLMAQENTQWAQMTQENGQQPAAKSNKSGEDENQKAE